MKYTKQSLEKAGFKIKGPIGQFFCSHKQARWFIVSTSELFGTNTEEQVMICPRCGKILGNRFAKFHE